MASHPPSERPRVLIVDDEPGLREVLGIALRRDGFDVVAAPGAKIAKEKILESVPPFPLVITDLVMPDGSGLEVLATAKKASSATEVVVMTAHSAVDSAVDAMRGGAFDFVIKPFSPAHIVALSHKALERQAIVRENQRLKAQLERFDPGDIDLGTSPRMHEVASLIQKVANTKTTVLITGESGTGKERIAELLHRRSERRDKPFGVVNCGALPEALMESELFGHEKGAFTGASSRAAGLFRDSDGGTVLLDEVGELPPPLQVKLLRVLQERKIRAVGGTTELPVDVRVLAATNRDVETEVKAGRFRQDLYYRLNVIRIEIPPLRDRREDVPRLAERFIKRFSDENQKAVRGLSPDALRALDRFDFPGNVRELENMMERAVALASGDTIGLGDLPSIVSGLSGQATPFVTSLPPEGCNLDEVLSEIERRLIVQALERTEGVRTPAAKLLGITFRSLRYRLQKQGIDEGESGEGGDEQE